MPCPGEVCLGLVDHHPGHVKAETGMSNARRAARVLQQVRAP